MHGTTLLSKASKLVGMGGRGGRALWLAALLPAMLAACATAPEPPAEQAAVTVAAPPPAAPPAIVVLPFNEAVKLAATDLLSKAPLGTGQKIKLVIDPLVDGNTGGETVTTAAIEKSLLHLVKSDYPQIEVKPFDGKALVDASLIMVGTFTPINLQGKADGERDAYRICFKLADLKSGKIVSAGFARARPDGIDSTPQAFFSEMPVWLRDPAVEGYIKTCQGTKVGDPIHPAYVDAIVAAASINEAKQAYNQKRYKDALAIYQAVLKNPAGKQARVYVGMYLTNLKLGRNADATKSFSQLVTMGLSAEKLAVRFNFKPGATGFDAANKAYPGWLKEIGTQSAKLSSCVEVGGHTARSGSAAVGEALALQRAEFVRQKISATVPAFSKKSTVQGYGGAKNLVGTGANDASDSLDDRIEFRKTAC
jgi:outer membrane protein OmpA-like peptidoglycan-associated protein